MEARVKDKFHNLLLESIVIINFYYRNNIYKKVYLEFNRKSAKHLKLNNKKYQKITSKLTKF